MSSACVCHTDEWCFYCEMFLPLERRCQEQAKEIEALRKGGPLAKQLDTKLTVAKSKLELAVKALEEVQELKGNIRPDGEAWEYVGEFNGAMEICKTTLEEIKRISTEGVSQ